MELADLVRLFAESLDVAVVLTDTDLERPGPTVLYANPAFARMSGYAPAEVVGGTPRILQGPGTNRDATRHLPRLLLTEGRFLGCIQNYRKGGDAYLCEIDVRPILGRDGVLQAFIAFEREVVRRRGRPSASGTQRFRPAVQGGCPQLDGGRPLFDCGHGGRSRRGVRIGDRPSWNEGFLFERSSIERGALHVMIDQESRILSRFSVNRG